ncbi:Spc98 family-domain-containing protein [Mycena sp. CBHHK59/15]|nr:Spc98 family-domain-containing protein [Mycena sp. CBHHK59/15]
MSDRLFHLSPLRDEFAGHTLEAALPEFKPRFFVPVMVDAPQNPIMDTLKLFSGSRTRTMPSYLQLPIPPELVSLTFDTETKDSPKLNDTIWVHAINGGRSHSEVLSWDALRPGYPTRPLASALISEQDSLVYAAARYYVQPPLHDPKTELKYVTQQQLLTALKKTVLGISSPLHTWDPISETFVPTVLQKGTRGIILVDGKDEVVSASLISRFLTIGTLLRRLETLLTSLRSRCAREGPTIHAFTHSLSTALTFLRESLARCPPLEDQTSADNCTLAAVWTQYAQYEEVLVALAAFSGRDERTTPRNYPVLDHTPINLLSLLYDHLRTHIECHSPKIVTAIISFILASTSREYFQQVSQSVGFGGDSTYTRRPSRVVGEQNDQYALDVSDVEERDDLDTIEDSFPVFFPPELVNVLPAAQKSLVLLRAAEPNHPLLGVPSVPRTIQWLWAWKEIEAAWNSQDRNPREKEHFNLLQEASHHEGEEGLAQFRIFDLEPGSHFGYTLLDNKHVPTPISILRDFIDSFPESLPPITPTLSHLTSLVFAPLVEHASKLSSTLLLLFISPSAPLQFRPHMELLHSYLLLAAPSFKSRLATALFSDSQGYDPDETIPTSLRDRSDAWPVGLSLALLERETWPPVGADLSFFLRTVIVDSFEVSGEKLMEGDSPSGREMFWVEAERRLGFAIRDLPTDPGHDQWLNPLSLDFLYMDYKPPHPLDILITPDILIKYQRVFTYLLRIMRVEHALSAVFRMSRSASKPLFPTLTPSNKRLLHFRFIAQSFVANLSEYVLDTAIGGNFDPFLSHLSPNATGRGPGFSDVFALARAHSDLMDDVLSACLLRSGQRLGGDLIRQALELVLEFSVLAGDIKTGRLEEYQATPILEDISHKFRTKMSTLTKVLKGLVDKGPLNSEPSSSPSQLMRKRTGGIEAIAHLTESLSDWWSNAK